MLAPILALLLAAADTSGQAPAAVTPASSTPASAPAKPADNPNKVVCKVTDNIGSRIQGRTCKTQAQWDADEEALRHLFSDVRAKTTLTNNSPGASGH
jgi:hypothetical protein